MPYFAKDHNEFLKCFCICCMKKSNDLRCIQTKCNKPGPKQAKNYENLIKRFFWENYSVENPDLPKMLCSNCRKNLVSLEKTDSKRFLFKARPKYEGLNTRVIRGGKCECFICVNGRKNGTETATLPPMVSCETNADIDQSHSNLNLSTTNENLVLCRSCFQQIGKGIKHPCTKLAKQRNLMHIVQSTSPVTKEKVLSTTINNLVTHDAKITLNTFGPKKLVVSIGVVEPKTPYFSHSKPGLHILLGIVDKLLKIIEKNLFEDTNQGFNFVNSYLSTINLARVPYQGKHRLEGNASNKFLKKLDCFQIYLDEHNIIGGKYMKALRDFSDVVHGCFGKILNPNYSDYIKRFSQSFRDLGSNIPLKVHIVEHHVEEFIVMKGGKFGLGYWTEQALESVHQDFKQFWEIRKNSFITNPKMILYGHCIPVDLHYPLQ
nr:uncharacterized protein LOC124812416 [Hydra vulgaris]